MTRHPSLAAHLLPLLLLVAPPARADWHPGSGILLNLPPICLNISDPVCIDVALQPISGVVFGLATPYSQYPGGGLAVRLVYNGEAATHKLACAGGRAWCSLDGFAAQVAALIAPHATWEAACAPAPEAVSVSVSAVATAAP